MTSSKKTSKKSKTPKTPKTPKKSKKSKTPKKSKTLKTPKKSRKNIGANRSGGDNKFWDDMEPDALDSAVVDGITPNAPSCPYYMISSYTTILSNRLSVIEGILNNLLNTTEKIGLDEFVKMLISLPNQIQSDYTIQMSKILFELSCIFTNTTKKCPKISTTDNWNKTETPLNVDELDADDCQNLFEKIEGEISGYMREIDIPIEVVKDHTDNETTVIQIFICLKLIYKIALFLDQQKKHQNIIPKKTFFGWKAKNEITENEKLIFRIKLIFTNLIERKSSIKY